MLLKIHAHGDKGWIPKGITVVESIGGQATRVPAFYLHDMGSVCELTWLICEVSLFVIHVFTDWYRISTCFGS